MAHRPVMKSTPTEADAESHVVQHYLRSIAKQLHGTARTTAAVIDEIRAGLDEAITARTAQGMSVREASEKAITGLGTPHLIAAAYAGELAIRQTRKTLWLLLLTGPFVGIWWFLLLAAQPGPLQPAIIIKAIPALPVVAAVVVVAAGVLATTGSLIRWLPESSPRQATLTAGLISLGILAVDTSMLAILATCILTGTAGSLSPTLAIIAATASVLRIPFAAAATWRCVRTWRRMPPI